jgi:hypothetical protein
MPLRGGTALDGPERQPTAEVRGKEPKSAVSEARGEGSRPEFIEGHLPGVPTFPVQRDPHLGGKLLTVALQVELEVELEAPGIPVGRAQEDPRAVHDHHFGVVERRLGQEDPAPRDGQLFQAGGGGPLDHAKVV